jgi:general secretion pathway protein I
MRGGPREAGFTLIELLVALSVFAIAALALLRLDGFAVATAADLDARAAVTLVAENEVALAVTDPGPIVRGRTTSSVSNAGRQFTVIRNISPTADQRLVRIDVVAVENGTPNRAILTTVKRVQ